MHALFTIENMLALVTLTALEIVLGIDNIVFVAILVDRLKHEQQKSARRLGLSLAMLTRIMLLMAISSVMYLTTPFFSLFGHPLSGRDLILIVGGIFLIGKATHEIHVSVEHEGGSIDLLPQRKKAKYASTIILIGVLDIVFSLDSVITAIGMAQELMVMITAIVLAVGVMLIFAGKVSAFIKNNPTFKILALSFLLLIGVVLFADGFGKHVDKGYIYFAMGFSVFVEALNSKARRKHSTASLQNPGE